MLIVNENERYRTVTKVVLKLNPSPLGTALPFYRTVTKVVLKLLSGNFTFTLPSHRTVTKVVLKPVSIDNVNQLASIEQ